MFGSRFQIKQDFINATISRRKKYNIVDPIIKWLPEEQQIKVINAIPEEHQPIFWWLKYHLRRPSEAAALHRCDYDKEQDAFIIRRTFSNNQLVQHTKTHKIRLNA